MKGIGIRRYGGLEALEEIVVPTPDIAEDEILIEVKAAAINRSIGKFGRDIFKRRFLIACR